MEEDGDCEELRRSCIWQPLVLLTTVKPPALRGRHNFFVRVLPYLVVAPIYLTGQTDFGTITQAAIAFSQIFSALSIVVTRFEQLTAFAASIHRLADFVDQLAGPTTQRQEASTIDVVVDETRLALQRVTLQTPKAQKTLVHALSVA